MAKHNKFVSTEESVYARYPQTAAAGIAPDAYIFVADGYYVVEDVRAVFDVAGGASCAADVKKVPSGTALASGVSTLGAAFDLTTGARTPITKNSDNGGLSTTNANLHLAPGDSLAVDTSGTLTALTGLVVQVRMKRERPL